MKEYGGFVQFLKGCPECAEQSGWQFPDEADSISNQGCAFIREGQAPGGWVQGGKEVALNEYFSMTESIKQSAFARIGIANQRYYRNTAFLTSLALQPAVFPHPFQLCLQAMNLLADKAPVSLNLLLTLPPGADTTAQSFHVAPLTCMTGDKVL